MKVIKLNANLTVILSDGTILTDSNCTDKMYIEIMQNLDDEDKIISIMLPNYGKKVDEYNSATETLNDLANSKILTVEGDKIFIKEISSLILPEELVKAIVVAEKADDQETLTSYLNFWTLCCLNPNAEARKNLFWFLKKYGMNISSSGLFVAYRNVKTYKEGSKLNPTETKFISEEWTRVRFKNKKSPKNYFVGYDSGNLIRRKGTEHLEIILGNLDDLYSSLSKDEVSTVFTDGHSNTFRIQVGKIVSMPREMCDEDQDVTCSRGLHVAGRDWLASGYFGDTSLLCLVNPADVVAVPPIDSYGKMRTCAYFPVQILSRDLDGNLIDQEYPDGFEDDFIQAINYKGTKNDEENLDYSLKIPELPTLDRAKISVRLDEMAKAIKNKVINEN